MKKLTQKQETFCQKFVELGSISDAYRAAYNVANMKGDTINNKAYILSNKGDIRARVEELQKAAQKRNELSIDRIIQELMHISFFDPADLFDENNNLKEIKDLPESVRRAIAEVKVEELVLNKEVSKKKTTVKMYSKLDSIEKFAKHLGFYLKDNEQKGKSAADLFLSLMQTASKVE